MRICGKIAGGLGMATLYRTLGPLGRCDKVLCTVAAALNWLRNFSSPDSQKNRRVVVQDQLEASTCFFMVSYSRQILLDVSHHHPL
jgi:hypothetical protein